MGLADFHLKDVGNIFTSIREAVTGKKVQDPTVLLSEIADLEAIFLKTKGRIIEAEAKSEHWIVSAWRPITMLTFVFIIANNYILVPYMEALFSIKIPALELTQDMWELIKLGLGGYVVSRGVEKSIKHWRQ